ncbi:unannotated protein [freshwater metagenome]|uniref:Unannotated protein n=1 Tax=freshwater metagenome TaxID=449393 RepID=A0A6J6YG30_9ZZZZ
MRIAGVEHLDADVLYPCAVLVEVRGHLRPGIPADEHDVHATGGDGGHAGAGLGHRLVMEAEPVDEGRARCLEVLHRDDDVVDAARYRVEAAAVPRHCLFRGGGLRPRPCNLDAVRLGQQDPHDLLGEIRVDAGVDGPLASGVDDRTHARRLDDRGVILLLEMGNLVAHLEPCGKDAYEFLIKFVDAGSEICQGRHRP